MSTLAFFLIGGVVVFIGFFVLLGIGLAKAAAAGDRHEEHWGRKRLP